MFYICKQNPMGLTFFTTSYKPY